MSLSIAQLDSLASLSSHPGSPIMGSMVGCDLDRRRITVEFESEAEYIMALSGDPFRVDVMAERASLDASIIQLDLETA